MRTVTAPDQTVIAYASSGDGPPLVLVHGTTADHHRWQSVAGLLPDRRLYAVDRRGRGGSGDTDVYAIEREFEDIAAVVRAAADQQQEPVALLGHSYGAICALGGARLAGDAVRQLMLYEPPIGPASALAAPDLLQRLEALLAQDRRDDALQLFFREEVRVPAEQLAMMQTLPAWAGRVAAAHTIPRELRAALAFAPPDDWFGAVTVPALLLLGGDSPRPFADATRYVAQRLSAARIEVLPGQHHIAMDTAPELFATAVLGFLSSTAAPPVTPTRPARR